MSQDVFKHLRRGDVRNVAQFRAALFTRFYLCFQSWWETARKNVNEIPAWSVSRGRSRRRPCHGIKTRSFLYFRLCEIFRPNYRQTRAGVYRAFRSSSVKRVAMKSTPKKWNFVFNRVFILSSLWKILEPSKDRECLIATFVCLRKVRGCKL